MSNDLILRQDAISALKALEESAPTAQHVSAIFDCEDTIRALPSAEPERKKGHWIDTDNYYQRWKCSECGYHTRDAEPNYCPHCGADMRGDQ